MRDQEAQPGAVLEARALLEAVYGELRREARRQRAGGAGGATLQTTALVHEAWLRLEREGRRAWDSRAQFFVAAASAMRRVLVDRARARGRLKRGGLHGRVPLDELRLDPDAPAPEDDAALLELDVALEELAALDPRLAHLVELRAFAGLTEAEAGEVLELSERTVRRDWRAARLWLYRRVRALREEARRAP
jgi:RNA polymerase sigma factor (TIGR02999 family)